MSGATGGTRGTERRARGRFGSLAATLAAAALLIGGTAAALNAQQVKPEARVVPLRLGIDLSDEQREALGEVAESFADRRGEPGASWALAAEVRKILTSEQIAELAKRQEAMRERMETRFEERRETALRRMERGRAAMTEVLGLSEEQRSRLEALREADGGPQARAERRASHRAAMEEILTDAQKEIVVVHQALARRMMRGRMMRRGARGGRMMRRAHPGREAWRGRPGPPPAGEDAGPG